MSRWLDRANGFAADARATLAVAKAWPQWRPSGFSLRMRIMPNAIGSASRQHKQAITDQKVNAGLPPHPIFRF